MISLILLKAVNESCTVKMAYIARLRNLHVAAAPLSGSSPAGAVVPARGDKWYIDPEEVRQYDAPFHIKWGGAFPKSEGPNWEHWVYMNRNSMYPRMPFYQRQLKNPYIKYDEGVNGRKNCGETYHIMEVNCVTFVTFVTCATF